jgi:hypothetical protein
MTERSVKGAMWRDKFRQQCLEVRDRDSKRVGGNGPGAVIGEEYGRSRQRSGASAGSTRRLRRGDKPKTFDPAADDDEDMSEDSEEQADNEEVRLGLSVQLTTIAWPADTLHLLPDHVLLILDLPTDDAETKATTDASS